MPEREADRGETISVAVSPTAAGERLDKYLGTLDELGLSRTKIQKLIAGGLITVNGETVATKYNLTGGENIEITVPPEPSTDISGENIPLDIRYQDEDLVVVNKPTGLVTHPGVGNRTGTLVNALVYHFKQLSSKAGHDRPGIVHRLDKETSGLLVVARNDATYAALQKAIQSRELKRTYLALVCGHLKEEQGTIDLPIGRSLKDRTHMSVTGTAARQAVTEYRLLRRYRQYDLLDVSLLTGRTHQIRVHLSHLGHPVFGDPDYGGREKWVRGMFGPDRPAARQLLGLITRQALHARRLEFSHPHTFQKMVFDAPLPADFAAVLAHLDRVESP